MTKLTYDDYPTVEQIAATDDVEVLLRWHRFLPYAGTDEQSVVIDKLDARLWEVRARDRQAFVAASKKLGHGLPGSA